MGSRLLLKKERLFINKINYCLSKRDCYVIGSNVVNGFWKLNSIFSLKIFHAEKSVGVYVKKFITSSFFDGITFYLAVRCTLLRKQQKILEGYFFAAPCSLHRETNRGKNIATFAAINWLTVRHHNRSSTVNLKYFLSFYVIMRCSRRDHMPRGWWRQRFRSPFRWWLIWHASSSATLHTPSTTRPAEPRFVKNRYLLFSFTDAHPLFLRLNASASTW